MKPVLLVLGGFALSVVFVMAVVASPSLARSCVWSASVAIITVWTWLYIRSTAGERPGLRLTFLLCFQTMAYTIFYQQQMTSLTLFALRAVDGDFHLSGHVLFHMSAGQFQALNPIWIMIASPVLASLYRRLGHNGRDLSLAQKMAVGFALVTTGFLIWWQAAAHAGHLVSPWIMVIGYGLISVAELLTMALGLAVVARYTASQISGFMMGSLYLLWGIAIYAGSLIANYAAVGSAVEAQALGAVAYVPLFRGLFVAALIMTALLVICLPLAGKWDRQHAAFQRQRS